MLTQIPQDLIDVYRSARYRVCDGAEKFVLQIDTHSIDLASLYRRTGQLSALFITAFNPNGLQMQDDSINDVNQERLRQELRAMTKHVLSGIGEDPNGLWRGESSWLALGLNLADSQELGRRYEQNAVLWADADAIPRLTLLC